MQDDMRACLSATGAFMNATSPLRPTSRVPLWIFVLLALAIICWGSAFAGIRVCLQAFAPGHLALLRMVIASLALLGGMVIMPVRLPVRRDLPGLLLMGFLGISVYHAALNYGEVSVPAGPASFLVASSPIFSILASMLSLGERPHLRAWLGVLICLVGVSLIAASESGGLHITRAAWTIVLASLAGGLYSVVQKRFIGRYTAYELVCYAMWSGTLFLLVFAPGARQAVRHADFAALGALVYLGVVPAAFAYGVWAYVLEHMTVSRAVMFQYLIPGIAVLVAFVWLDEVPKLLSVAGGVLTVVGVYVVNAKAQRAVTVVGRAAAERS